MTDWGITVLSVEIRDIIIPKELQGVMSLEAQAECRKNARIALMEAERDVSAILQEVAETYSHDDIALSLRKMHLTYEACRTTAAPSWCRAPTARGLRRSRGRRLPSARRAAGAGGGLRGACGARVVGGARRACERVLAACRSGLPPLAVRCGCRATPGAACDSESPLARTRFRLQWGGEGGEG